MTKALIAVLAVLSAAQARADGLPSSFVVSIEQASPLAAVPSGTVSKSELAPIPGAAVSDYRPPVPAYVPHFAPTGRHPAVGRVPVPVLNPTPVSFCLMDLGR